MKRQIHTYQEQKRTVDAQPHVVQLTAKKQAKTLDLPAGFKLKDGAVYREVNRES